MPASCRIKKEMPPCSVKHFPLYVSFSVIVQSRSFQERIKSVISTLGLSAPDPDQEDDPPGPLSCGNNGMRRKTISRSRSKETAKLNAAVLLARLLKAASPVASHPGKAWE
jgi:hypothetical protein